MTSNPNHRNIVEIFNNGDIMATVNFSVPEDIKQEFNRVFAGRNKSAIVADLLRQAIDNEERQRRHVKAVDTILAWRDKRPRVPPGSIRRAREELRR